MIISKIQVFNKNYYNIFNKNLYLLFVILKLDSGVDEINIICYGLGSIYDNFSSRYQFALLLLLIDEIDILKQDINSKLFLKVVQLYDPVFNQTDKYLLRNVYKFNVSEQNYQCFCSVDVNNIINRLNLFYMPHCGKALYNNLLFSNWSVNQLESIVLLGKINIK